MMRKTLLVWISTLLIIFVLSACSDDDNAAPEDVEEKDNQTEETESSEEDEEEVETSDQEQESNGESESESGEDSDDEGFSYDIIIDLGFDIFEAQVEEDYEFLESVLSEGSSLNKEDHTFQFDNVTYPHEFEFISEKDNKYLSELYVNGDEKEGVTAGYEVTDFTTESSYVIDTEFIKEDGEWKINDIDLNK